MRAASPLLAPPIIFMVGIVLLADLSSAYARLELPDREGVEPLSEGVLPPPEVGRLEFTSNLQDNGPKMATQPRGSLPQLKVTSMVIASPNGQPTEAAEIQPLQPEKFAVFSTSRLSRPTQFLGTINEPGAANRDNLVFFTGNWYAAKSLDGGATWSYVDPYTDMVDLCCDQDVIYEPSRGIFVWYRQGKFDASGVNRVRVGVSTDLDIWQYYNIRPVDVNKTWTNQWFDYPHLTYSSNYLYISTTVHDANSKFVRAIMLIILLDQLKNAQSLTYRYYETALGILTPAHGGTALVFWATHIDNISMRIWRWQEASGTVSFFDRTVPAWTYLSQDGVCIAPDGTNFCGRADHRVTSGWRAGGKVGFFWNAGAGGGFPYPYVNAATFRESDLAYLERPNIWSQNYAWLYAYAAANLRGHLAVTAFFGGGSLFPSVAALIDDDLNGDAPPWEAHTLTVGTAGPSKPEWGDYIRTRPYSGASNGWIATGFTIQSGVVEPRFYVYGRERDNPVLPLIRFELRGISSDPKQPILRIDSSNYTYSQFPLSFNWQAGSSHTVQAFTTLSAVAGTRFVWTSWTNGGTLSSPSGTYTTPTTAQTVSVNYGAQYRLTVVGGNNIVLENAKTADGWYDSGGTATVTTNHVWDFIPSQKRQNLVSWRLDEGANQQVTRKSSGTFTAPGITMNGPHTLAFNSATQYFLAVSGGASITYTFPSQTGDNWFDSGTQTQVLSGHVWQEVAKQSRQNLISVTRDGETSSIQRSGSGSIGPTLTFDAHHTVTFNYVTQYFLEVVGGSNIRFASASPTGDRWFDSGQQTVVMSDYVWDISEGRSRRQLVDWQFDAASKVTVARRDSGSFATPSITMDTFHAITFLDALQFFLSIDSGGGELDKASHWLDQGASVTVTALSPSNVVANRSRLIFAGWSGSVSSSDARVIFVMDNPKTLKANWRTQYYVRVTTAFGQASGEGWYDAGSEAKIRIEPLAFGVIVQQVFEGWTGDITSTSPELKIQVDSPKHVAAEWRTDYTRLYILTVEVAAFVGVGGVLMLRRRRR